MPKLSDDTLLKRAIEDAVSDRDTFSDAYGRSGPESDEALALIENMRELSGRSFRTMTDAEKLIAHDVFLYAQQWRDSLALAQVRLTEKKYSQLRADRYREVRMRRWGKTKLEHYIETTPMVILTDPGVMEMLMKNAKRMVFK